MSHQARLLTLPKHYLIPIAVIGLTCMTHCPVPHWNFCSQIAFGAVVNFEVKGENIEWIPLYDDVSINLRGRPEGFRFRRVENWTMW